MAADKWIKVSFIFRLFRREQVLLQTSRADRDKKKLVHWDCNTSLSWYRSSKDGDPLVLYFWHRNQSHLIIMFAFRALSWWARGRKRDRLLFTPNQKFRSVHHSMFCSFQHLPVFVYSWFQSPKYSWNCHDQRLLAAPAVCSFRLFVGVRRVNQWTDRQVFDHLRCPDALPLSRSGSTSALL